MTCKNCGETVPPGVGHKPIKLGQCEPFAFGPERGPESQPVRELPYTIVWTDPSRGLRIDHVEAINPERALAIVRDSFPDDPDVMCFHGHLTDQLAERTPELQPCPFCHSSGHNLKPQQLETPSTWTIRCYTCCCYGPISRDAKEAAEEWNRRRPIKAAE